MILLTGAAGKTGKAILDGLKGKEIKVRAFVRDQKQANSLSDYANLEFTFGDLHDPSSLVKAVHDIDQVYYICPNLSQHELETGQELIRLAKENGVKHFVYHSVLHPQVEKMPHHWQKMRMEEALFESGLNFTILQPCAYMQNILGSWSSIIEQHVFPVPYSTSSRISMVDLSDIGIVASKVLTERGHENAIYELAGPESLSQDEVAEKLSEVLKTKIRAQNIDRKFWSENAKKAGMSEFENTILLRMFEYYENYGFIGNSTVHEHLLGRKPTNLVQFLIRHINASRR